MNMDATYDAILLKMKPWQFIYTQLQNQHYIKEGIRIKISELKTAATLLTILFKNCEEFQMRYCASMWLNRLQNCRNVVNIHKLV